MPSVRYATKIHSVPTGRGATPHEAPSPLKLLAANQARGSMIPPPWNQRVIVTGNPRASRPSTTPLNTAISGSPRTSTIGPGIAHEHAATAGGITNAARATPTITLSLRANRVRRMPR
jgi:hypothetical protein